MFSFQSKLSLPKCELQTTLQWFHSILSYLTFWSIQPEWEEEGQTNSGPLCTFSEADQSGLEKGRELLTEGGGEATASRMQAYPLRAYRY